MERLRHDGVLVVGAGLAGLSAALAAAPRKVLVLSPVALNHGCASAWAQGGMAAALSADDAPELHARDTVNAGAGLVDPAMARLLAEEGPAAVRALAPELDTRRQEPSRQRRGHGSNTAASVVFASQHLHWFASVK